MTANRKLAAVLIATPAASHWRGCWHHPLQLPCHGSAVDDSTGSGLRQRLHPEAQRKSALTANLIGQLLKEAGLPDGVFNVVHGAAIPLKVFVIIQALMA